ncbi:MAG: hypothetical protein EOP83_14655 [Verrucomicrobiaceae bacterium]|nr:MAG: hypothetical protein EOP83_14655 [Verrucomicrobiaceae bacterium]
MIERFRAARFFGLEKDYVQASDSCPTEMRLRTSDRDMTVRWDRHGEMPGEVHGIADAIEAAADSTLWIQGNDRTIASFLAEGANFNGSDGAYLVAAAMRLPNEQVVLDAIEAGVPLEVRFPPGVTKAPALGIWLVREAAQQGASRVFALLTRRDWLRRMPHSDLGAILAGTAGACEPSIIRALVDAGADVNYRLSPAAALNSGTPSGATVLMRVLVPNHECHGKDVELALEALIDLGADVNMRDDEGTPVILLWPDDALTLHLLEAGADPAVTDAKGRTLRQTATDKDMSGTLAWLDAHGLP